MSNSGAAAASGGGVSFCGLLAILFIALKLCGVIDWSWWWVLAPIWGPFALFLAIVVVVLVVMGIAAGIGAILSK
jgi:hypothetical protein